jgi:hypothetical protein
VGMRERAARLGRLELDSAPGRGTRLALTVNAPYDGGEPPGPPPTRRMGSEAT